MNRVFVAVIVLICGVVVMGCRSTVYSMYETVGIHKRDLLKKYVVAARDQQQRTQGEFKDALTRLKELTAFEGGDLEKTYNRLQGDYDDAADQVEAVRARIKDVETVAKDLFSEWEKENRQIETESLRRTSRGQLAETRERYEEMIRALKDAERTMDPVLRKLRDYVLVLKHSLNAQAIASLRGESLRIQEDIAGLIEEMTASIEQADEFVRQMQQ